MILIGNNYRYQRFSRNPETGMINSVVHTLFHSFCRNAASLIMSHNCPGSCLKRIQLAFRIAGRRILMAAPVIQNSGNMINLLCCLRAPENKIIVLSSVIFISEAAYLFQQRPFYHKQMADIVYTGQKVRIEIRLKMRIKKSAAVHIQLILI